MNQSIESYNNFRQYLVLVSRRDLHKDMGDFFLYVAKSFHMMADYLNVESFRELNEKFISNLKYDTFFTENILPLHHFEAFYEKHREEIENSLVNFRESAGIEDNIFSEMSKGDKIMFAYEFVVNFIVSMYLTSNEVIDRRLE